MPDRSIEDVLDLLPAPVEPDAAFEARLRERLASELQRDDSRAKDNDNDDEFDTAEVLELEANTHVVRTHRPGLWLAVAAVLVAVMAATVVATRDDGTSTTVTAPTRTYAGAELTAIRIEGGTNPPYFVAVGEDAWVLSLGGDLTRIGRESGEVLGQFTVPESSPVAVDQRAVWVAGAVNGDLLRLDPRSGDVVARISTGVEILPFTIRIPMLAGPSRQFSLIGGITSDGSAVWVGDRAGRLMRIDPATNEIEESFPVAVRPDHIRAEADAVLVADLPGGDVVVIDRQTGDEKLALEPRDPLAGAALYDGSLYLQDEATGVVTRIDLASGDEVTSAPLGASPAAVTEVPTLPTGLVVGAAGVLVATDSGSRSLHVLDPVTLEERGTLEVKTGSGDMTIGPDGSAWIVRMNERTVIRIEPVS
jgi:streptogramin lyase